MTGRWWIRAQNSSGQWDADESISPSTCVEGLRLRMINGHSKALPEAIIDEDSRRDKVILMAEREWERRT